MIVRLAAAAGMLAAAIAVALYAHDVWRWQRAIDDADARARLGHVAVAAWRADTVLPQSWSRSRLGLDDDLAFRRTTAQALAHIAETGDTDNQKTRGIIETALARIVRNDTNRVRASEAANMLGVLLYNDPISPDQAANAYQDPQETGPAEQKTPEEKAEAQFITAVALDPANENAARDLELMLRRPGPPPQRGAPKAAAGEHLGNKGSGAREAGHGY
jgi:hypothetical protein